MFDGNAASLLFWPRLDSRRVRPMLPILTAAWFLAAGLFLAVAPWSDRWEVNRFYDLAPRLRPVFLAAEFRVAVTLLGAVLVLGAFQEARGRRSAAVRAAPATDPSARRPAPPPLPSAPAEPLPPPPP